MKCKIFAALPLGNIDKVLLCKATDDVNGAVYISIGCVILCTLLLQSTLPRILSTNICRKTHYYRPVFTESFIILTYAGRTRLEGTSKVDFWRASKIVY